MHHRCSAKRQHSLLAAAAWLLPWPCLVLTWQMCSSRPPLSFSSCLAQSGSYLSNTRTEQQVRWAAKTEPRFHRSRKSHALTLLAASCLALTRLELRLDTWQQPHREAVASSTVKVQCRSTPRVACLASVTPMATVCSYIQGWHTNTPLPLCIAPLPHSPNAEAGH